MWEPSWELPVRIPIVYACGNPSPGKEKIEQVVNDRMNRPGGRFRVAEVVLAKGQIPCQMAGVSQRVVTSPVTMVTSYPNFSKASYMWYGRTCEPLVRR
jgi:hypothetical protein